MSFQQYLVNNLEQKTKVISNEGALKLLFPTGTEYDHPIEADWEVDFSEQSASNRMWLLSLDYLGFAFDTEQRNAEISVSTALDLLESFLDYVEEDSASDKVFSISSGDHACSVRINVLLIFLIELIKTDSKAGLQRKIRRRLDIEIEWALDDQNYHENNHGLMLCISMLHASLEIAYEEIFEMAGKRGRERIIDYLNKVFDKDGLCDENTVTYHVYLMDLFKRVENFFESYYGKDEFSGLLSDKLNKAAEALEKVVYPCGGLPPIGDSGLYSTKHRSKSGHFHFEESGWVILKSDDQYLSIISGSRSETHKHCDDSSITLRYKGKDVFVDSGIFNYDWRHPLRAYVLSQRGHSGAFFSDFDLLDRNQFKRKFPEFQAWIDEYQSSEEFTKVVCISRLEQGLEMKRSIYLTPEREILLIDRPIVDAGHKGLPTVQRLNLAPEAILEQDGAILDIRNGAVHTRVRNLSNATILRFRGEEDPARGWFSRQFAHIEKSTSVELSSDSNKSIISVIKYGSKEEARSEFSQNLLAIAKIEGVNLHGDNDGNSRNDIIEDIGCNDTSDIQLPPIRESQSPRSFISLGQQCSVAQNMLDFKLKAETLPFDWMRSPDFQSINELLLRGCHSLFDEENLSFIYQNINEVKHRLNNIEIVHEVADTRKISDSIKKYEPIYKRRFARFYQKIMSLSEIVFVRDHYRDNKSPAKITENDIKLFFRILYCLNPNLKTKFILVYSKDTLTKAEALKLEAAGQGFVETIFDPSIDKNEVDSLEWKRKSFDWEALFERLKVLPLQAISAMPWQSNLSRDIFSNLHQLSAHRIDDLEKENRLYALEIKVLKERVYKLMAITKELQEKMDSVES